MLSTSKKSPLVTKVDVRIRAPSSAILSSLVGNHNETFFANQYARPLLIAIAIIAAPAMTFAQTDEIQVYDGGLPSAVCSISLGTTTLRRTA